MNKTISRRSFMKLSMAGLAASAIHQVIPTTNVMASQVTDKTADGRATLIACFSHSGNTQYFADLIHSRIGGNQVEIKTVQPYPRDYDSVVAQAREEQDKDFRPVLAGPDIDPLAYDRIFVGYPNWWGTMPMALFTFFEKYDFSNKSLIAFSTHEGSGFGQSIPDLKRLNPRSTIIRGLAIRGRSIRSRSAKTDINEWLDDLSV